jgi:hypothetical protein
MRYIIWRTFLGEPWRLFLGFLCDALAVLLLISLLFKVITWSHHQRFTEFRFLLWFIGNSNGRFWFILILHLLDAHPADFIVECKGGLLYRKMGRLLEKLFLLLLKGLYLGVFLFWEGLASWRKILRGWLALDFVLVFFLRPIFLEHFLMINLVDTRFDSILTLFPEACRLRYLCILILICSVWVSASPT